MPTDRNKIPKEITKHDRIGDLVLFSYLAALTRPCYYILIQILPFSCTFLFIRKFISELPKFKKIVSMIFIYFSLK